MRLEQDGIAPDMLLAEELATMFMLQEVRKVQRGWLDLFNNSYFSVELAEYHKDEVRVSYDLSDASAVNVFDMDGKFITKAQANGNIREAFPTARLDQLAEKRRKGKIKRAENAIRLANAEVNPALEQAAVWDELRNLGGGSWAAQTQSGGNIVLSGQAALNQRVFYDVRTNRIISQALDAAVLELGV